MAKIHVLKTWPEHWKAVESGAKTFEARKDDRDYAVGDVLVLRMFSPNAGYMRDAEGFPADISRRVTHLLEGGSFGIEAGHVVMSIAPLRRANQMVDIVERLRGVCANPIYLMGIPGTTPGNVLAEEAADEIERLRELISDMVDEYELLHYGPTLHQMKVARATLKGETDE